MQSHPMPRRSRPALFNPRMIAAFGLCLIGAWVGLLSLVASSSSSANAANFKPGDPVVPHEFRGDLRNLPQLITDAERKTFIRPLELDYPVPAIKQLLPGARAQSSAPSIANPATTAPMSSPNNSFDGMSFNLNGAGHPPDPVGDVGPNHFVQAVNTSVGIFDKATGTALATFTFNSLWANANTGTSCDTFHGGDPRVIYVPQFDRFVVADFSWSNIQSGPFYECVAVSKTSDPVSGGWWFYPIRADDAAHPWFPDYPKMGIWPDGLYMTANMFDCLDIQCNNSNYKEARVYAFDINDLVNGATLHSVVADTNSNVFTLLPSNYRGTPPPAGTPNYVVSESVTSFAWEVYKFHPDYSVPSNSTFLGPIEVSQAPYVTAADSVPEPSGNNTDTLADRAMMQNQYRNIGGVESIWVNHTTGTPSSSTPTGIQWAQINVTGGAIDITPVQEQIFNNGLDGLNRFMGSLAVDQVGNMAVGYTASSSTVAPDIRYAGRLSTDPANVLPQTEVTMLPGITRSVQTGTCGGSTCIRWGDYSAMTVDPTDDCTFWYTNMYFPVKGPNWVTRIGSFRFSTCSATSTPTPTPTATPTPTPTPTSTPNPSPTIQVTVQTAPAGLAVTVDGTTYNSTQTFSWASGSSHTIATTSPQSGGTDVRYAWTQWSDGGAISHTVTSTTNKTYTATFRTQYYLTMTHGTGGTVIPASGWESSGASVSITAIPTNNTQISYSFAGWTGSGPGSYSGTNNPASIVMSGPITETASFTQNPVQITVQANPTRRSFSVDSITYTSAQTFSWQPGSSHRIATTSPQSGGTDIQYVWRNWSDAGTISHVVAPTANKTYTANFTTQYFLTMTAGTGGKVSPASGWRSGGAVFSITATPLTGYTFTNWTGTGTGSFSGTTNPASVTMGGPISETATFTSNP